MDRKSEDARIIAQDRRGPVALVNIAIGNQHALHPGFPLHGSTCNSSVIEYAVALRTIVVGMVGAAGQTGGGTLHQRHLASSNGGATRAARALDQAIRPGKTELADFALTELAAQHAPDVASIVRKHELILACRLWDDQLELAVIALPYTFVKQSVLVHRKAMPGWQ